jgi:hypothetical protein
MTTPHHRQTTERLRSYIARLKYVSLGHETPTEVAQYLIDRLAYSGDVELFPLLRDSLPEVIKTEALAYLTELASAGFARYIYGVGSSPISEEALLKDQERVRNNYARLGELAGVA